MDGLNTGKSLAVIIPVLDDHIALQTLAGHLDQQTSPPDSVIVVSGSANAAVAAVARSNGFRLIETHACRGLQLDVGAESANTDLLWFLHADAIPSVDAVAAIRQDFIKNSGGGGFSFRFQGPSTFTKRTIERLVRYRVRFGGMAYGDQALYCTRAAYEASGGYPHEPLFEEHGLVRFLQSTGNFRILEQPIFVSCRRWERDGWLRRCLQNRFLATCYGIGVPARRLATIYRPMKEARG